MAVQPKSEDNKLSGLFCEYPGITVTTVMEEPKKKILFLLAGFRCCAVNKTWGHTL